MWSISILGMRHSKSTSVRYTKYTISAFISVLLSVLSIVSANSLQTKRIYIFILSLNMLKMRQLAKLIMVCQEIYAGLLTFDACVKYCVRINKYEYRMHSLLTYICSFS